VDGVLDPIAWSTGRGDQARRLPFSTRLLRQPGQVTDPEGELVTITYADWPDLADFLQAVWEASSPQAVGASLQALRAQLGIGLQQEDYPNFVEGFPGVACSETHNPRHVAAWSRAARAQDRPGRAGTGTTTTAPGTMSPPTRVLVVGNLFDPATPYHGAVTVDRLLPRSRLLTLAGWGHTSLFASACIDGYVNSYLLTTRVPPRGTVCQPDVVPFAQPPAAQALQAAGASSRAALLPPAIRRLLDS
jgi:hypothetical protein